MYSLKKIFHAFPRQLRTFSTSGTTFEKYSCKVLVVGGGSGGCALASKFSRDFKKNELIVLDPSDYHYYQPLFTLIGGGAATLKESRRNQRDVIPKGCTWLKDKATGFDLKGNLVTTGKGDEVQYEFLLVATGLELRYDKIPGLLESLSVPDSGVCSNYSPDYVDRTFKVMKNLNNGKALFTFPNSPVKCPGAPQKICYITDHFLRKNNKRNNVELSYNTSLPVIFGVKKYADALWKVCEERGINVNLRTNLVSIDVDKKEAVFEHLDDKGKGFKTEFSMLHVTPPMETPEFLSKNKDLTNNAGFIEVDASTLQHVRYPNVFAIGDCASTPNSKTAAAAAAQSPVVYHNMKSAMTGKTLTESYDGYASCPLVTGYDKCILAEFDYDLKPLETFPFSQDRELYSMYLLKKHFMPSIYWKLMMNGYWNGPATFRKLMHLEFSGNGKQKLHM